MNPNTITICSYEERLKAWQVTIESTKEHIEVGRALRGQGIQILQNIEQNYDYEKVAKLINQATTTFDKGIKIERVARDKLLSLYQEKPKNLK
jgi:hypothetical protein